MNASTYKYLCQLEAVNGNESTKIDPKYVTSMIIDYDYDNLNMPVLYVTMQLDKRFVDTLIMNANTTTINLSIYKFIDGSDTTARTLYFRDQFSYYMKEQLNQNDSLDYGSGNETRQDVFKTVVMGLISVKNVNDNKTSVNNTFYNTTMMNAVQSTTKHIKNMLIEPLDYNATHKLLIVKPQNTVAAAIKYLNDIAVFYKTQYRFFLDFNGGYLLSKNGKAVEAKGETINSIIIDVGTVDKGGIGYFGNSMVTDMKKKVHIVPVLFNTECFTVDDEFVTEKMYTNIKSVTASGTTKDKELNINNSEYNTDKNTYVRIANDNTNKLTNIASSIESNRVSVTINKSGLDTSVFTPNKVYTINNYSPLNRKDACGTFILIRKREQYTPENNTLLLMTYLTFKKVGSTK